MDKRTLDLAAKAAGYKCKWWKVKNFKERNLAGVKTRMLVSTTEVFGASPKKTFMPHINKSDFYDLAEAIGATIKFRDGIVTADFNCGRLWEDASSHGGDIQKALVALAARIGEAM